MASLPIPMEKRIEIIEIATKRNIILTNFLFIFKNPFHSDRMRVENPYKKWEWKSWKKINLQDLVCQWMRNY